MGGLPPNQGPIVGYWSSRATEECAANQTAIWAESLHSMEWVWVCVRTVWAQREIQVLNEMTQSNLYSSVDTHVQQRTHLTTHIQTHVIQYYKNYYITQT